MAKYFSIIIIIIRAITGLDLDLRKELIYKLWSKYLNNIKPASTNRVNNYLIEQMRSNREFKKF